MKTWSDSCEGPRISYTVSRDRRLSPPLWCVIYIIYLLHHTIFYSNFPPFSFRPIPRNLFRRDPSQPVKQHTLFPSPIPSNSSTLHLFLILFNSSPVYWRPPQPYHVHRRGTVDPFTWRVWREGFFVFSFWIDTLRVNWPSRKSRRGSMTRTTVVVLDRQNRWLTTLPVTTEVWTGNPTNFDRLDVVSDWERETG